LGIGNGYITLTDEAGLIVAVAVLETATRPKAKAGAQARRKVRARKAR
jgi:hypothetical protein